jgi:uncharacterized protein
MIDRPQPSTNRLSGQTSPYLLDHAAHPVAWEPWDNEALSRARQLDRPILVSIGYSACHWCHVMADESFADDAIARVMNELFVNIKIDREERPDIDRTFQIAVQLLTRRTGGWPLTVFLTPDDHMPFFGGTYFPKVATRGSPAFVDLLKRVEAFYRTERASLRQQSLQLKSAFDSLSSSDPGDLVATIDYDKKARDSLESAFDSSHGGFTDAPKFPHPGYVEQLLRQWYRSQRDPAPDLKSLYMATLTLTRMAEGGLRDHVGGGFFRYSTDDQWMIPHFEKMLTDNALLVATYSDAFRATCETLFLKVVQSTTDWMLREMQTRPGIFATSLDADSAAGEGRYYVWERDDVARLLPSDEYSLVEQRFGLDGPPNFENRFWHLHACSPIPEVSKTKGLDEASAEAALLSATNRLFVERNRRMPPRKDATFVTSANALAIRGLSIAARTTERTDVLDSATAGIDFIRENLLHEGRLYASHCERRSTIGGFLDDHAFLLDALLEHLATRWRTSDLLLAIHIAEILLTHFEDPSRGGFWFTAHDAERLVARLKSFADEATPSGNGIAAKSLLRLGYLLGEQRYIQAAERTLQAGMKAAERYVPAHGSLIDAYAEWRDPTEIVVIRGDMAQAAAWQRQLAVLYAPRRMIFAISSAETDLPTALGSKCAPDKTTAFVCKGTVCDLVTDSFTVLVTRLRDGIRISA